MMKKFKSKSLPELKARLEFVNQELEKHSINSTNLQQSRELIESMKGQNRDEVRRELAARGLPPLEDQGKTMVTGAWSFWKLNRSRQLLEKAIERRESPAAG
ncbi:hypothetical protein NBM05_01205 [Rothia sp. AR01]|uniref:Uncharacterized protein n=1 Tax=Rothia santali TaxID=2949643 RepID=A0A9X2HAR2_9MICC|nr:hypothetical protein [Rothia santali]MCP3424685.1 hypothetical protein [Rothia santali]